MSPGPATLLIAATSAAFGWRRALPLVVGLLGSMVVIMVLVGAGLAEWVLGNPGVAAIGSGFALVYMVYLAYRIATAPPVSSRTTEPVQAPPGFRCGFALNFVNPKAYAAVGAAFTGFSIVPRDPLTDVGVKCALSIGLIALGHTLWLAVGETIARFVRSPRSGRALNVAFAACLLVSLVALAA